MIDVSGGGLGAAERSLIECVVEGRELDLGSAPADGAGDPAAWGEPRTIRADVLRAVLLGRLAPEPDPRSIAVRGARIAGRLDVDHVESAVPLALRDCLLSEGMTARNARLESVTLVGSRFGHRGAEPAVDAAGLVVRTGLDLSGARVEAQSPLGAVRPAGARVGSGLDISGPDARGC